MNSGWMLWCDVCVSGGRSRRSFPIITFPECPASSQLSDKQHAHIVKYLTNIPAYVMTLLSYIFKTASLSATVFLNSFSILVPYGLYSSFVIIRPHCSTTYVDAAYCYRPSSMVCRFVCHTSEPCRNGWADWDAVWIKNSGGPGEPYVRWGPDPCMGRDNFEGEWASYYKV